VKVRQKDFRGQQPHEQIPDGHRLVLSCTSYQCVRSLKPVGTFELQLPIFLDTRPNNQHTRLPRPPAQTCSDRLNFPSDRGITGVKELDQDRHFLFNLQKHFSGGPRRYNLGSPVLISVEPGTHLARRSRIRASKLKASWCPTVSRWFCQCPVLPE